jgi:hypothetical protein
MMKLKTSRKSKKKNRLANFSINHSRKVKFELDYQACTFQVILVQHIHQAI